MKIALFSAEKSLCADCSLALKRFIGGLDGVESIEVQQGKIAVQFDEKKIDQEMISEITRGSIEKLGYKIEEQG